MTEINKNKDGLSRERNGLEPYDVLSREPTETEESEKGKRKSDRRQRRNKIRTEVEAWRLWTKMIMFAVEAETAFELAGLEPPLSVKLAIDSAFKQEPARESQL